MTNVLPPEGLHARRKETRARFVLVGSLVLIVCAAIAMLALLPSYAIVRTGASEKSAQGGVADEVEKNEIVRTRLLLSGLLPVASSTVSLLEVLDQAIRARPSGIFINNIIYKRDPASLILFGSASSRERIKAYRDALAKNAYFKNASVPIQDLTGSDGGRFTLTLTGSF